MVIKNLQKVDKSALKPNKRHPCLKMMGGEMRQRIITLLFINDEQINNLFMITLYYKFMSNSQHGFVKNESYWNNLLIFHEAVTGFLERRDVLTAVRVLMVSAAFWERKLRKWELWEFRKRVTTVELSVRNCVSFWCPSK